MTPERHEWTNLGPFLDAASDYVRAGLGWTDAVNRLIAETGVVLSDWQKETLARAGININHEVHSEGKAGQHQSRGVPADGGDHREQ